MKKLVAVSGIAAIAIIGALTACRGSTPVAVSSAPAVSTSAPTAAPTTATDPLGYACAALDSNGYCSSDDPSSAAAATSAPPASTAPAMSAAEQQAVDSAQSYLALG